MSFQLDTDIPLQTEYHALNLFIDRLWQMRGYDPSVNLTATFTGIRDLWMVVL